MNKAPSNHCEPADLGGEIEAHRHPKLLKRIGVFATITLILVVTAGLLHWQFPRFGANPIGLATTYDGQEDVPSGEFQRGVASSVVKYAEKDYTKASWKLVYDIRKLPNPDAKFHTMAGWDKNNIIIHGEVGYTNEGAARLLVLKLKNGKWQPSDLKTDGHYAQYKAVFQDKDKYLFYYQGRGPFPGNLVSYNNDKLDVLSTTPVPIPLKNIYQFDEDSIYLVARFGSRADLYKLYKPLHRLEMVDSAENKIAMDDSDAQKIQALKQEYAFSQSDLSSFDSPGAIRGVKIFTPENAVGFVQEGAYESSNCGPHKTPVMLVEYRGGQWHLKQLIVEPQAEIQAAWFMNQSNFVTAGRAEINIIGGGKVSHQKILIGNNDYTGQDFSGVWGQSMEDFYVMTVAGDVFHYTNGAWNMDVKGPDLKHEPTWDQADGEDVFELLENNFRFDQVWVSPDGAVFGLRRKTIYMLD